MIGVAARALGAVAILAALAPAAAAQDLRANAQGLLGQGLAPEQAAVRLLATGAYPEDVAAVLFELAPRSIRGVSFVVVKTGAAAMPDDAIPLAVDIVGRAPTAAVPAAAALALAVPAQAPAAAASLSQTAPQATPLIAATMARLVRSQAPEIAAAAARAVPAQAAFAASAVSLALPDSKDAVLAAVATAIHMPPARVEAVAEASEAVGANAVREADEALAGLPLPPP